MHFFGRGGRRFYFGFGCGRGVLRGPRNERCCFFFTGGGGEVRLRVRMGLVMQ